jgi:hypothetical protein
VDIALIPFVRVKRLTKVSDEFLLFLSSLPCPKLKEINVAGHADMTDFGVTILSSRLPMLQKFDVSCCSAVTQNIASFCPWLVFNTDPVGQAGPSDSTSTDSDGTVTTD